MASSVFGFNEVMANLNAYSKKMQANIQIILEAGGNVALQLANELCRVDTGYMLSRNELVIAKGSVTLQNDTPYAIYNELGTYKMAAQPWLVPGFVTGEAFIKSEFERLQS